MSVLARSQMMLIAVDWLAGRVSEHNGAIDNHIPALDDFTLELSARRPNLQCYFFDFVSHTIPRFGYEISRRHLSLNDLVLA